MTGRAPMTLKRDVRQLFTVFLIIVVSLILATWFVLLEEYLLSAVFYVATFGFFILMIIRGRGIKEEYAEVYV